MQIPQYLGPSYLNDVEKVVPLTPIRRHWYADKTQCTRTGFALLASYAMTIHKSQGQGLDDTIIDLGECRVLT